MQSAWMEMAWRFAVPKVELSLEPLGLAWRNVRCGDLKGIGASMM